MPSNGSWGRGFRRTNSSGRSLPSLEEMAAAKLTRMRTLRATEEAPSLPQVSKPLCPHPPSARQRTFLGLPHLEALFGGAAGGGKTDCALMSFLQYAHVPGYTQIILRRTKTDLNLPDSALARAHAWWRGSTPKWNSSLYGYEFPTLPGQLPSLCVFGFMQTEADKYRYQSAAFQTVWFEELTQFTDPMYTYLFSRLRKPKGMPVPLRMRATSNPGGVGHEWVKARFVKHARPEGGHFVSPPTKEEQEAAELLGEPARGAAFVPSKLSDNPGIDMSYRASLARLDAVTRRQLEDGDWDAVMPGEYFQRSWFRIIQAAPVRLRGCRYWDLAGTKPHEGNKDPDWTAGARMHIRREEDDSVELFIPDVRRTREDPGGVENFLKATAFVDGRDLPIWIEEEPGSSGKSNTVNYQTRVLPGFNLQGHRKTGDKPGYWKALSAQAMAGRLSLVEGDWNEEFIRELCGLPSGKKDQADASAGAFDRLISEGWPIVEDYPTSGDTPELRRRS